MTTQILFPKLGFSADDGTLAEWLVADGGQVAQGQPLYVLETGKATQEIEAPASGTLRVIGKIGETYQVGDLLGEIL